MSEMQRFYEFRVFYTWQSRYLFDERGGIVVLFQELKFPGSNLDKDLKFIKFEMMPEIQNIHHILCLFLLAWWKLLRPVSETA